MTKVTLGNCEFEVAEVEEKTLDAGKKRVTLKGNIPTKRINDLLNQIMRKPVSLQVGSKPKVEMSTKKYCHRETDSGFDYSVVLEPFDNKKDLDTQTLLSVEAAFGRVRMRALLSLLEEKGIIKPEEYEERFEAISHGEVESVIGNIMEIDVKTEHAHKHEHTHEHEHTE